MKNKPFASEQELAAILIEWLERNDVNRQVYSEVQIERGGPRADIVVVVDGYATVVETKLAFTFDALVQASRWRQDAHQLYVATPPVPDLEAEAIAKKCCEALAIGWMRVTSGSQAVIMPAPFCKLASERLTDHLIKHGAEYKSEKYAKAGSKGGGAFTECNKGDVELAEYVAANPGCSLKEAIGAIRHTHHSDQKARNYYTNRIKRRTLRGVQSETFGGMTHLYPITQGAIG